MAVIQPHPRYGEAWGSCGTCGHDQPKSKLKRHKKWGWQCFGVGTANCWDGAIDREMQIAAVRYPKYEGVRKTKAPITKTLTEGVDGDVEAGDD